LAILSKHPERHQGEEDARHANKQHFRSSSTILSLLTHHSSRITHHASRKKTFVHPFVDMMKNFVTRLPVMKSIVAFAQALADDTRWRTVQLILNEPMCVRELAEILDKPQSSVSSHVQVIKKAGMLESEPRGKWIYYRVAQDHRKLLHTVAEFFEERPSSDAVLRDDAKKAARIRAERGEASCPPPKALAPLKPFGAGTGSTSASMSAKTKGGAR
jgi:ArsR family transcriptional regulator